MADNKLMTEIQTAELIGKTIKNLEIDVDLSDYSTSEDIDKKFEGIEEKIQNKVDSSTLDQLETTLTNKLSAVYRYKGTVDSYDELPKSNDNPEIGDVYDVANGMNYAWNGTSWDALGDTRIEVDSLLSESSTNPVQNKVIYAELENKASKELASSTENGLMSFDDKKKLDDIEVATQEDIDSAYTTSIAPHLTIIATAK